MEFKSATIKCEYIDLNPDNRKSSYPRLINTFHKKRSSIYLFCSFFSVNPILVIFFLGSFLLSLSAFPQIQVDSLLILSKNASEEQKCNIYVEIAQRITKDSAKSNSYIRMAYKLAKAKNFIPEQAKALYSLGQNSFTSLDYEKALDWFKKSLVLYESLKDSINSTNCYKSIGLCHYSLYQNEKAITLFIEGLKYCETDKENTAKLLSNIAMTHQRMGNKVVASSYYHQALALNASINNLTGMGANYNGIGMTFKSLNRMDSALINYFRAHRIYKKIKRRDNMAITLNNIAGIYLNFPDSLNKSIQYYNEAWEIFNELGWKQYEAEIRQGIGYAFYIQGKYEKAIENYKISNEINEKYSQGFQATTTNYDLLSRAYEKLNDYKTALNYNKLYIQFSDSLHQKEKYEKLINLEKKYELQKKENEIIKLQASQELTAFELKKNQQLKQLGFITILILLILIFFVLKKYIDKNRLNKLLAEKNQIIEKSEQELQILNASKNKFFSIIAHDLKNPFHTVMGYSSLLSKKYDHFNEDERRKFADDIYQSTNNIYRLLQNLLDWSRSQTGRLIFTPANLEFKQINNKTLSVLNPLAKQKNITIQSNFDENIRIYADPSMIETVLRNLVNNAIKFTPENGLIEIKAEQYDGTVQVCVRDTGIGINDEDINNLFRIESKVKRKGTNNEDGSGLGLILCKEFIDKNYGTIWAERNQDGGSSFLFTIPTPSNS
jgi:signal transduction histidine kinase